MIGELNSTIKRPTWFIEVIVAVRLGEAYSRTIILDLGCDTGL